MLKLKITAIAGLTAAALSATLLAATPAQAESRTFLYGTYGSAKYEGVAPTHLRKSLKRKRNNSALRFGKVRRKQNFLGAHSRRTKTKSR